MECSVNAKLLVIIVCLLKVNKIHGFVRCDALPDGSSCSFECSCCLRNSRYDDPSLNIECYKEKVNVTEFVNKLSILLKILSSSSIVLTSLTINGPPLVHLPEDICKLKSLEELVLTNLELSSLTSECFMNFTNLTFLSLEYNKIVSLPNSFFHGMLNLTEIRLGNNLINNIQPELFLNLSTANKLNVISFTCNRVSSVDIWPLFFRTNEFIVDLSYNKISSFTNKLNYSYSCVMPQLRGSINFSNNQIKHIMDMFYGYGFKSVRDLNLWCIFRDKLDINIGYNPLICDCYDYPVYEALKKVHYSYALDQIYCAEPPSLKDSKLIKLLEHMEVFVCHIRDNCPERCDCLNQPATHSLIINCNNCGMIELPSTIPTLPKSYITGYGYDLNFSNNQVSSIVERNYYNVTKFFRLNNNRIQVINIESFRLLVNTSFIYLQNNQLTALPKELETLRFYDLKEIHLYGNPWLCNCHSLWMKKWLKGLGDTVVVNANSILCHSDDLRDQKSLLKLEDHYFVCSHIFSPTELLWIVVPSVTIGLGFAFSLFIGLLYAKRKWLYKTYKLHPFDVDECYGENMLYDLFLSSANNDEMYVNDLVSLLEKDGFKVCYHKRDFLAGEPTLVNIGKAIVHSKRTVCFVTSNFHASDWCIWEFETALNLDLENKRHRLVVIKGDIEISDIEHCSLRTYLRRYTYIEKASPFFWENLQYSLPINKMKTTDKEITNENTPLLF